MRRVLIIDDDPAITSVVKRGLAFDGFRVDIAGTGHAGLAMARDRSLDAVVLDLMLPGLSGWEVLERLREADPQLPVLMLTARDTDADQVQGLERGADDYMIKPFSLEVLAARLRALLRRRESSAPDVHRFADLSLDTGTKRAQRGSRDIDLTATEYEVLLQFLLHPRRVLAKHFLMERVWGLDSEAGVNLLEVYVSQLRHKLESAGDVRLLHTFRGAGYVLREP